MTRAKLIGCAAIVLGWLTVASVIADTNSLPDLRDLNVSGWDCVNKPEGNPRDAAGAARNRSKNRDWTAVTATNVPEWTVNEFLAYAHAFDKELVAPKRQTTNSVQSAKLASLENQIV